MKGEIDDIRLFQLLLKQVGSVFLKQHTTSNTDMSQWKGEDIVHFQEDLRAKTQSSVSEKWFYTYVKNSPSKLPRIDILNMLSLYVGYSNWHAFREQYSRSKPLGNEKKYNRYWIGLTVLALLAFIGYTFMGNSRQFHFCFKDMDTKNAITNSPIDIVILNEGESPSYHKTDSLGCFSWKTEKRYIRFVARSPYYKTDTIYRSRASRKAEPIRLRTDDYALMLHYYGSSNVKDWETRRTELRQLIADDALIFEVLPHQLGVELYRKEMFINKLTTPTTSLRKLEIVATEYRKGQIVKLKFKTDYGK